MIFLQIALITVFFVGFAWLVWTQVKPYIDAIRGDKPKPETCTAKQEMEHYQTLLDEWEPVEGSPLHESLVQAIADAQVRADAAMSEQEWQAHIRANADEIFRVYRLWSWRNARDIDAARAKIAELNRNIDELKARRDKARKYLADSRRAV